MRQNLLFNVKAGSGNETKSYGLPSELNVKAEYDFGKYIKTIGNGHQLKYFNKLN